MWSPRPILAILALMLSSVNAVPWPQHAQTDLISRDISAALAPTTIGVYFCPEPFWKGTCQYLENGPGLCSEEHQPRSLITYSTDIDKVNLDKTLAGKVSSLGPDEDASGCDFFQ